MNDSTMDKVFDRLLSRGVSKSEFRGCSPQEIGEIKARQGVSAIPGEYLCYLQHIGRGAGSFQKGTDAYYPNVLDLKEAAEELLEENGSKIVLGPKSLVFEMHQGYEFAWFPDVETNRPAVNWYSEVSGDEIKEWPSLPAYLMYRLRGG
ncbi:hypothetical protein F1D05_36870 [Kribbella qitaiheensis]|uniref:SMI1/KNR4 family protein n=1 Tax=Kribbella qitaiheensis TaxID=1544730 RepID=A0A7G6X894_9ACTN|nr:hypothetical protein [Kribbella qitaiheensis]QNE22459.1 hypothetical protein F1D05_36870 [Kribbella qitaiheensis]